MIILFMLVSALSCSIPNCETCSFYPGLCSNCFPGYQRSISPACSQSSRHSLIENCEIVSDSTCEKCSSGYLLFSGRCEPECPDNCICFDPNVCIDIEEISNWSISENQTSSRLLPEDVINSRDRDSSLICSGTCDLIMLLILIPFCAAILPASLTVFIYFKCEKYRRRGNFNIHVNNNQNQIASANPQLPEVVEIPVKSNDHLDNIKVEELDLNNNQEELHSQSSMKTGTIPPIEEEKNVEKSKDN